MRRTLPVNSQLDGRMRAAGCSRDSEWRARRWWRRARRRWWRRRTCRWRRHARRWFGRVPWRFFGWRISRRRIPGGRRLSWRTRRLRFSRRLRPRLRYGGYGWGGYYGYPYSYGGFDDFGDSGYVDPYYNGYPSDGYGDGGYSYAPPPQPPVIIQQAPPAPVVREYLGPQNPPQSAQTQNTKSHCTCWR